MSLPAAGKTRTKLEVAVDRPTPYTFDLGLLLAHDANPITTSTPAESSPASMGLGPLEAQLIATARDGAQGLINQLLTTCPVTSTPEGVLLSLPSPSTPLPREKPLPQPRAPTKWEQFAARRGIRPKTREQRRAKAQRFDEATGRWEKTWGYDRDGRADRRERGLPQRDWLVEVDEDKEREEKEARRRKAAGAGGAKGKSKTKGGAGRER